MEKILPLVLLLLIGCAHKEKQEESLVISKTILETYELPFKSYPNSLRIQTKSHPLVVLHQKWKADHPEINNIPKEFSIPVLNENEFEILTQYIEKDEIESVAKNNFIQNLRFNVECIGENAARIQGKTEKEVFVVLYSQDIIGLRLVYEDLYVRRGGNSGIFHPANYQPHITFGTTKEGLSIKGLKNDQSCVAPLELSEPF